MTWNLHTCMWQNQLFCSDIKVWLAQDRHLVLQQRHSPCELCVLWRLRGDQYKYYDSNDHPETWIWSTPDWRPAGKLSPHTVSLSLCWFYFPSSVRADTWLHLIAFTQRPRSTTSWLDDWSKKTNRSSCGTWGLHNKVQRLRTWSK